MGLPAVVDTIQPNSPGDFAVLAPDNRPEPRTAFDFALRRFLDDLFEARPTWATAVGHHAYDDRWPDVSESGRAHLLSTLRHHRARFEALPDEQLSAQERIDRGIVLDAIAATEFEQAELRDSAWDPLSYVYLVGSGLFGLLAREFAPWQHRGSALAGRLSRLPALLSVAASNLIGVADRPVSLLHTHTALAQLGGIGELIDTAVAEAEQRGELVDELRRAAGPARAAVEEFGRALRDEIAARASGEGRLGAALFADKLRHTLASDLTPSELERRARADYETVRSEMIRLARELWPEYRDARTMPAADDEVVARVLDAIAREHRRPDELLDYCRAEVARIEDFCRSTGLIGLADEPIKVTWTPVFMRAYGRAFLDSPGPLDKGLDSYFWITPPDEADGAEAVESYLREDNDRMLRLLTIHEGVPGHYLQGAWANRSPSLVRGVFSSGTFAEGWAVYVTQVMMDAGYGGDDPALMLSHWKFYLRAITNTLMDIGIHTAGMSEQEAMSLMVERGWQEPDEARAKWLRARLTSTQLSTYYVGAVELTDLEAGLRRRQGAAFDRRAQLESFIRHGAPPIKWLRRILLAG
jgi:uncharacterized protein (DUF885 family)